MQQAIDQLLPSLEALGLWSYWIIGAASMLEAFFATGAFTPGTLVVDAGGVLVQRGVLDYFDLVWFVAIGSILGGEMGYWLGIWARRGLNRRWRPEQSPTYQKAARLFARRGGMALVMGRFLGPVSGLVPFAAAIAGLERRRFIIWNIASGFPYAFTHVTLGYFLGDILARIGPLTTRLALLAAAVLAVLALLWWLVARIMRMLPFVLSILRSVAHAVGENPEVKAWAVRHPALAHFLASRLDRSRFSGLTATLLFSVALYIFVIWVGSALDFLMADPILATDMRLANLAHTFWSPGPLRFFAYVSASGDWQVVGALLLAALGLLAVRRRYDLIAGLLVALVGNSVSVAILKMVFHRPRPELAYFVETSGSFPSGHAALAVAFYAMLFYIAWRLKWLWAGVAAILAVSLAFLIGLSRIYLIEHYLTDVLNGWLIGALWLVIGIAIAEWWRESHDLAEARAPRRLRLAAGLVAALLLIGAGWFGASRQDPRNHPDLASQSETITPVVRILTDNMAPSATESIAGTPLEPINVIIVAKDSAALHAAMVKAGWIEAAKPGLASLARALWAALGNAPYDDAPVTPYFWNNAPNSVAFQRPTDDNSLRERHHVRFWPTRFLSADGGRIFVGAASFDDGLDWTLLHHIDPNIDAERDLLAKDLRAAGLVGQVDLVQVTTPHMGQSVAGDPWFTDGKAAIMRLVP